MPPRPGTPLLSLSLSQRLQAGRSRQRRLGQGLKPRGHCKLFERDGIERRRHSTHERRDCVELGSDRGTHGRCRVERRGNRKGLLRRSLGVAVAVIAFCAAASSVAVAVRRFCAAASSVPAIVNRACAAAVSDVVASNPACCCASASKLAVMVLVTMGLLTTNAGVCV